VKRLFDAHQWESRYDRVIRIDPATGGGEHYAMFHKAQR
jgi:hypothetical protein